MPSIEINPTSISLVDMPDDVLGKIDSAFSWDIPGFFFQTKNHKQKHPVKKSWCYMCQSDGKKHLLGDDHSLPIGFYDILQGLLKEWGVDYELNDLRPPKPEKQYDWHCSLELRDYQTNQVQMMIDAERGTISAATGSGKSIVAAAAICELGLPSIVVVPTKLLLGQFIEVFQKHTDIPVGLIGSGKYEASPVQVAIAKSLVMDDPVHPDVVTKNVMVIDEMHLSSSDTWQQIISNCPARYRFGFSATPYRDSELEDNLLVGMCGSVIAEIGVEELQESGHLAKTDIRMVRCRCGYDRMVYDEIDDGFGNPIGWREATYAEKYRQAIVHNGYRNQTISRMVNHHLEQGQKVLVIISFIEHAEVLMPMFDQEAIFLTGRDTAKQTEEKRMQFLDQTEGVCIGTSIVDQGFDVPDLDVLVMAGGGEFDGRTIQRLGRGLRPTPRKDTVIVYDLRDDDKPTFMYHSKGRMKAYEGIGQTVTEYETFDAVLDEEKKKQKQFESDW